MEMLTSSRRWCGVVAATGMAVAGAFHVVWAFSPWPMDTWDDYSKTVLGDPTGEIPNDFGAMSMMVAVLLFAAAYLVSVQAGLLFRIGPRWMHRVGIWVVAGVLLVRATVGLLSAVWPEGTLVPDGTSDIPYQHWNLLFYSPLCLVLGALTVGVAWGHRWPERSFN